METTRLEVLLDERKGRAARSQLAKAEVIIGIDLGSQRQFTVFGTPSLEETVVLGSVQALDTARVELNVDAGDLDRLAQLIREIKGRSDFVGTDA